MNPKDSSQTVDGPVDCVVEGRVETLQDAVNILTVCKERGFRSVGMAFRDLRDAAAAPIMLDDPPALTVIPEEHLLEALQDAAVILRPRLDHVVAEVYLAPSLPRKSTPLCIVTRTATGEQLDALLDRLAPAILDPRTAVIVCSSRPDLLKAKALPVVVCQTGSLAAELARLGSTRILVLEASDQIGPDISWFRGEVEKLDPSPDIILPPFAISPDHHQTGVTYHDPAAACVKAGVVVSGKIRSWKDLRSLIRDAVQRPGATKVALRTTRHVALKRNKVPVFDDNELVARARQGGGDALFQMLSLPLIAAQSSIGHALMESLPVAFEQFKARVANSRGMATAFAQFEQLQEQPERWRDVLATGCAGLAFDPAASVDRSRYATVNPDLMLRRLRGEEIDEIDHLYSEAVIEGRFIPVRPFTVVSVNRAQNAFAFAARVKTNGRLPWMGPKAEVAANLRLMHHEIWHGRLAAALQAACRAGDRLMAMAMLARLGARAMVAEMLGSKSATSMTRPEINLLFDLVLPPANPAQAEPAIVARLLRSNPSSAGLRCVDYTIESGDYELAKDRLNRLRKKVTIPVTEMLPRLHAMADWPKFVAAARKNVFSAHDRARDLFFSLIYLGRIDEAKAALERHETDPAQRFFFLAVLGFLTGDSKSAAEALERSIKMGAKPYMLGMGMGFAAQAGEVGKADERFVLLSLLDGLRAPSQISMGHYMERFGRPDLAITLMRAAVVQLPAANWTRTVTLFYLNRLFNFARRPQEAARAAIATKRHNAIGSCTNEPEYLQTLVSVGTFSPWLAPAMKASAQIDFVPQPPADFGIDRAIGIVRENADHRVFFIAFQTGDAYLFLYCLSAVRQQMREVSDHRPILVVAPKRLLPIVGLFAAQFDKLETCEIADFYRLKQAIHDEGMSDTVAIGHYEFLYFDHDGKGRTAPFVMPYVPTLKHALGLEPDYSGQHPLPQLASPVQKGKKPRVLVAPHANSMPLLDAEVWIDVVAGLASAGFEVFVNQGPHDPPTKTAATPLSVDYPSLLAFAHECDVIIGLRSGLLDIVAGSPARIVEVYNGPVYTAPFLHIWELAPLRPDRETRVVRVIQHHQTTADIVSRILAAATTAA